MGSRGFSMERFKCDSSVIRVLLQRFVTRGKAYELMFGAIRPSPVTPFIILRGGSEFRRPRACAECRRHAVLSFF